MLGDKASLLDYQCSGIRQGPAAPARAGLRRPGGRADRPLARASCAISSGCSTPAARQAPATSPSCRWTRGSSTRAPRRSRPTRSTSTPRTSSGWRSRAAATRSPRRSACSGSVSRKYAHKIPFIVKINHNEMLTYPNIADQTLFASVEQAWNLGAVGIGATIYYGSEDCRRQILEISEAFQHAHELGLFTVLWCYLRNPAFKHEGTDYHAAADLTGQANHLGRHHRGRHRQAEAAHQQRRLHGARLRQDPQAGLRQAGAGPPDRVDPLAGRQLLHGSGRADQLGRCVGLERSRSRRWRPRSSTSGPAAPD